MLVRRGSPPLPYKDDLKPNNITPRIGFAASMSGHYNGARDGVLDAIRPRCAGYLNSSAIRP